MTNNEDTYHKPDCFHQSNLLQSKVGLVIGIANEHSIAYGCAKYFRKAGADLAITYLNPKAETYVRPLAEDLGSSLIMPLDVSSDEELDAVFNHIEKKWGRLDFVLHSIANAPKEDLQGRLIDCSAKGFSLAMDVSVHSFIRVAKKAEPLMSKIDRSTLLQKNKSEETMKNNTSMGGALLCMSYYGAEKVVENYNLMGPVKAALQSVTSCLAVELGSKGIRVNAISPGPISTRAASGIQHFDHLINQATERSPEHMRVSIDDVGALATFLVSDFAKLITGNVEYIDGGYHCLG